ncbi:virulence factor [Ilumatobacter coccineus]|uniref:DUF1638 domain-containing protein n=1 Tax=Ilumatobacter coccineus (strain NBRC 103263 / KCTC 29153 / YM16-304) TaxID=1313172 RepID=A0A6C7E898_ILUCY|nr:virulence factor [Ilumatobacter coccineus]BAN03884.1 hypothetical protein YM304_35700 [Ilumatobacter coccineus YM16-304]
MNDAPVATTAVRPRTLVIACGALAHEMKAIVRQHGLERVTVECLPAALHNRPQEIPDAVRARIRRARAGGSVRGVVDATLDTTLDTTLHDDELLDGDVQVVGGDAEPGTRFDQIFIGYADCGTGGLLAQVCDEEGVEMLAGAHCYQFFATAPRFDELQDHEIGSFYLTDFLVKHFDRLVWQGLGIEQHPELLPMYFGNYTRLVYLAQTDDPSLVERAEAAAARLGLSLIVEPTGYGELETTMVSIAEQHPEERPMTSTDDTETSTEPSSEVAPSAASAVPDGPGPDLGPDQGALRERQTTRRGGRRRGGGSTVSTISWRDIPAQLTARSGDEQHKVLLHARFQHAIDRAAAIAGLTTTNDYVQEWRTASQPAAAGDLAAQLDQRCAELEGEYPRQRLEALVANGGLEPSSGDGRATAADAAVPDSAIPDPATPHSDSASESDPT